MGHVNTAFCKTDGCMIEHRAIDLNLPEHIAAWNTRASDPNTRVVHAKLLSLWADEWEKTVSMAHEYYGVDKIMIDEIRAIIGKVK